MQLTRDLRLAAIAAAAGAALFGWSVGGVASVDGDLQAAAASTTTTQPTSFVADGPHHHGGHGSRF